MSVPLQDDRNTSSNGVKICDRKSIWRFLASRWLALIVVQTGPDLLLKNNGRKIMFTSEPCFGSYPTFMYALFIPVRELAAASLSMRIDTVK